MSPLMPPVRYVETNGIRMAVYADGPADQRPPLVLCHGFPELAFSWRHQIRDLAAQGFRVLAPDQRGYGLTDAPPRVEDYDIVQLTGDLVGLLDAEGIEKAVFVGHDWGGLIVWAMPHLHSSRTAGVIGLNTPYQPRLPMDPIELFRLARGDDFYIVFFQKPDEPERIFEADIKKTMQFFMRRGSLTPEAFENRPKELKNLALQDMIAAFDPASAQGEYFLTPEELDFYVAAFERSGIRGGINWYRNFTRNWRIAETWPSRIEQPCLMIMAELDVVLPPSMADGMGEHIPNLKKVLVKCSGHWTQQEKPEEVTAAIAGWMRETF